MDGAVGGGREEARGWCFLGNPRFRWARGRGRLRLRLISGIEGGGIESQREDAHAVALQDVQFGGGVGIPDYYCYVGRAGD